MKNLIIRGTIMLAAAVPAIVSAAGQHGAHVHGMAEITLALEGNKLEIVFTSPAMDVLGFEHKATSDEHRAAVADAQQRLGEVSAWLKFQGTECNLVDSQIDFSSVLDTDSAEASGHDHSDNHEHEHEHEHEDHGSHDGHDSDEHHHEDGAHSDVSAHYHFSCADGGELEAVRLGSEDMPFGLEKINAMWVSERGQGSAEVTADQRLVELR